jgi:hypothetical protein
MCVKIASRPLVVPRAVWQRPDGRYEMEYTLALAKALTKDRGGDHVSSAGTGQFRYPLGDWVADPGFRPGSHDHCLHFGTPAAALAGELSSYGSHVLICLPSVHLWGAGDRSGRCWHDAATLPIGCLACDGLDLETLGLDEFWADLWRERRIAQAVAAGDIVLPNGLAPALDSRAAAGPLWRRQTVLPAR